MWLEFPYDWQFWDLKKIEQLTRRLITLSSLIQVTGSLLKRFGISPQILLFQPGLWVKVCFVYYCTLVWNLFFLLESIDDVIVTSTEGFLFSVFQPGLWVNGMACLVIQTCFWKKSGMSPNTTWLVLKRKEYQTIQYLPLSWLICQEMKSFLSSVKVSPRATVFCQKNYLSFAQTFFTFRFHETLCKNEEMATEYNLC